MQQIESSVAMVTKPIQWEEFAAYDKLFSTSFDTESWLNQLDKLKQNLKKQLEIKREKMSTNVMCLHSKSDNDG